MKVKLLEECISEAERFLKKAKVLNRKGGTKTIHKANEDVRFDDGFMVASVKRASLDLSKMLAQLRKSDWR
jgi:hypothetical protein